jgi:hypothetical protein
MEEVLTAPRSPWPNPYAERLIGSIRTDCLNHFVILNARHLKRTLASYFEYYHGSRTHLGLDKQVRFLGRSRVSAGSSRSRNWAACITVMNVLLHNDMPADAFRAKDSLQEPQNATTRYRCASRAEPRKLQIKGLFSMVGARGFEPRTPCAQGIGTCRLALLASQTSIRTSATNVYIAKLPM